MYFYILTLSYCVCINIYLLLQGCTARCRDRTIVPQNGSSGPLQSHEAFSKSCWKEINKERKQKRKKEKRSQ
jgi:hypothetical protein